MHTGIASIAHRELRLPLQSPHKSPLEFPRGLTGLFRSFSQLDLDGDLLNLLEAAAGVRQVVLEPELVQLLREHKVAASWTDPEDFVFAGRIRQKPRERNSVRTKVLTPQSK